MKCSDSDPLTESLAHCSLVPSGLLEQPEKNVVLKVRRRLSLLSVPVCSAVLGLVVEAPSNHKERERTPKAFLL